VSEQNSFFFIVLPWYCFPPPCNLLSYDVLRLSLEGNSHELSTIIGQDSHHVFRMLLTAAVYGCRNLCCRKGPHRTGRGGCFENPSCISRFFVSDILYVSCGDIDVGGPRLGRLPNLFSHRTQKCVEPLVFGDKHLVYGILTVLNFYTVTLPQYAYPTETMCCTSDHGYVTLRETSSTPIINVIVQWIRHPIYQETVNVTERKLLQRRL
jgi:hypothetical protein